MKLLKFSRNESAETVRTNHGTDPKFLQHKNNFFSECCFHEMLGLERRRSERTRNPICLMLFDVRSLFSSNLTPPYGIIPVLASSIREIDICGWYTYESAIGIIFTSLDEVSLHTSIEAIQKKIVANLLANFSPEIVNSIKITHHLFPEEFDQEKREGFINPTFYPNSNSGGRAEASEILKRTMDIIGSIVGLLLFLPFFIIIPVVIKLTSKGPVLFRQERIGLNGRTFTFLKFRSMYMNSDDRIHREYITQLMAGKSYGKAEGEGGTVFKITNDPRITPIGRLLRKSSLDELPQFINVLLGDMSLVGPRPPIPYEFKSYDPWHRNRLMSCKPGITGLWQVEGRSLTTFDGMVRMDLKYIREWSLWLDLRILLQTPLVVLKCKGAY